MYEQWTTGTMPAGGQEPNRMTALVNAGRWGPSYTLGGRGWELWGTTGGGIENGSMSGSAMVHAVPVADDGISVLDCGVCYRPLKPPIFQCGVGHVLCSPCSEKLKDARKCHLCGVAMPGGYQRCHAMDDMMNSIRRPCPNAAYGCDTIPVYHAREEHILECPHAPFSGTTGARPEQLQVTTAGASRRGLPAGAGGGSVWTPPEDYFAPYLQRIQEQIQPSVTALCQAIEDSFTRLLRESLDPLRASLNRLADKVERMVLRDQVYQLRLDITAQTQDIGRLRQSFDALCSNVYTYFPTPSATSVPDPLQIHDRPSYPGQQMGFTYVPESYPAAASPMLLFGASIPLQHQQMLPPLQEPRQTPPSE